jgi:hypothetical protein
MNDITRKSLFDEAFALLKRAQELLSAARGKHEQKLAETSKKAA